MKFVSAVAALCLLGAAPAHAALAPPNAAGLSFGHIHLNVPDIEAQNRFWTEYFGGRPFRHGGQAGVRFADGFILLLTRQASAGPSAGSGLDHFGFKVPDLAAFLAKWRAGGLGVINEITGMEGTPAANLAGPNGVKIEVQEDRTVPYPIANHVHFQTADNAALRDWYVAAFGLEATTRGRLATAATIPGMGLSFSGTRIPVTGSRGRAIDHIGFETVDLAAQVAALKAKGIAVEPAHAQAGLRSAFLTDPQGVRIELTQGLAGY